MSIRPNKSRVPEQDTGDTGTASNGAGGWGHGAGAGNGQRRLVISAGGGEDNTGGD